MAKMIEVEDAAVAFIKELDMYLVDYSLTETDKKMISAMFRRNAEKCVAVKYEKLKVIKEPIEVKIPVPVYYTRTKIIRYHEDGNTTEEMHDGNYVDPKKMIVTPMEIIEYVEENTGIEKFQDKRTRAKDVVRAKRIAVYLMHKHCQPISLTSIGKYFVGSWGRDCIDHTTVIHHLNETKNHLLRFDEQAKAIITRFIPKWKKRMEVTYDTITRDDQGSPAADAGLSGDAVQL